MDSNNIRHWRYMESQRKARRRKKIRNRVIILILLVVGGYCVIHFINDTDNVLSYVHTTTTAEADFQESLEKGNLISDTQSNNLGTDNFGIVEDEKAISDLIRFTLSDEGYNCECALMVRKLQTLLKAKGTIYYCLT